MAPKGKQKESTVTKSRVAAKSAPLKPPDWPALRPLVHPLDLELKTVVEDQIVTISNFWTSTLCKNFVSFLSTLPLQTTPGKPKRGDAVRVNDRYQIEDPVFAQQLWSNTALKDLVVGSDEEGKSEGAEERRRLWGGKVVGLNPNIRIYRYGTGQFFAPHYDDTNLLTLPSPSHPGHTIPARTTWTLLIYLTSPSTGCTGGETVFYPDADQTGKGAAPNEVAVSLGTGMALLHRHGADCMLHEGREVTAGEKWVVRSDLCVER